MWGETGVLGPGAVSCPCPISPVLAADSQAEHDLYPHCTGFIRTELPHTKAGSIKKTAFPEKGIVGWGEELLSGHFWLVRHLAALDSLNRKAMTEGSPGAHRHVGKAGIQLKTKPQAYAAPWTGKAQSLTSV